MSKDLSSALLERFESIVGASGLVTDPDELMPALTEWRGLFSGQVSALLAPETALQVSEILTLCNAEGIGVVPQGGNTGLVGGAIPHSTPQRPEIILSARHMHAIREIDADNYTITAEAGCLLAGLQDAATDADRFFPLSLAAEGSCQIGGNISTNAGGTNVLRFGNTRDLVLGLEVVLPDGRIYDGLRGLRKDNTGYDLKQLFIGAEGTLGFITAATFKLFPRPRSLATAWLSVKDPAAAIRVYSDARKLLGDQLIAFELMNRQAIDMVLRHIPDTRDPLSDVAEWYLLLELGSADTGDAANHAVEQFLVGQMESGLITDGVLAQSSDQRNTLWRIRHSISEAQKHAGAGIKHDISVPVSKVGDFLKQGSALVRDMVPGIKVVAFGHLGDGNIHFNLNQPDDMERGAYLDLWEQVSHTVHTLAVEFGGSFSAEHGIGMLKKNELARLRGGVEVSLMGDIKRTLDPNGIMNPGKLLEL